MEEEAEKQFEEIAKLDPYRLDDMDIYSNILFVMSKRSKLGFLAQIASSTDKFRPETCCIIGNYYSLLSEHEKAVIYFRRALKLNRNWLSAWTLMGHEYVEMKNTHAAIEAYRRAVDVNRKDYRAWYGLGQTYEVLEMHYYALYYYQRAAALKIPEISQQALYIEKILENFQHDTEESKQELEFIFKQFLLIIKTTDLSDEMGNNIPNHVFSENLITHMVEVFRKITSDEKTFVKLLAEMIVNLLDSLNEQTNKVKKYAEDDTKSDDSFVSVVSNQENIPLFKSVDSIIKEEMENPNGGHKTFVIFRCLCLTQAMLENIEKNFRNNFEFIEILNNLIVPSVRSHNASIREKGLRCLGLCCLLDKQFARENLILFCHCLVKGHDSLQVEALKIITDIFMCYKYDVFDGSSINLQSIQSLFEQILQNTLNIDMTATAVEAVSKLMLTSFFDDPKLLKILIILYFDPKTSSNLNLRQILTYFIPVYCYSSPKNQFYLQEIFVSTLHKLLQIFDDLDDDIEPIPFSQIVLQMMDWVDPKKQINPDISKNQSGHTKENKDIHLYLAKDICTQISESYNKEERRTLCTLLNKLHITSTSNHELTDSLQKIVLKLLKENNSLDSFAKNSLNKFFTTLCKLLEFKETNYTSIETFK
ncbi:unnamed protein product [Pneumocystis jirovecii]|uniref:Nuclear condensin complex subunit 3 C-terminal domain-containing protein n=1 Tax=Pneumocystis jirovecii TaxID=42068 RepID=L0PH07_PNEJI|nr:unnamed protein product [Pneumocystis jirovecii]